ncbi:probable ubiquitin carboxyl-terminal hydrolase MINDY-4 [Amphiura filiformis]|uniref:probable ubiquitin carboxyl-terminal hydrolase MINDY-4 n=1 Tax=Amphiura filiformis TaxID=82378 RepID=UPI003B226246
MEKEYIENLAASLVREYLSRKGLKSTLLTMDEEWPRTENSISNRVQLAKEIHIHGLTRLNKKQAEPLRAMIEVMTKFFIEEFSDDTVPLTAPAKSKTKPSVEERNKTNSSSDKSSKKKSSHSKSSRKSTAVEENQFELDSGFPQADMGTARPKTAVFTVHQRPDVQRTDSPVQDRDREVPAVYKGLNTSKSDARNETKHGSSRRSGERPSSSASRSRGMAGPITSSLDDSSRRRHKKSSREPLNLKDSIDAELDSMLDKPSNITKDRSPSKLKDFGFNLDGSKTEEPQQNGVLPKNKVKSESRILDGEVDLLHDEMVERPNSRSKSRRSTETGKSSRSKKEPKTATTFGDIEIGDIDDLDEELGDLHLGPTVTKVTKAVDARPITMKQAMELKTLLFGSPSGCFNEEWTMQGLPFCDLSKLEYGIVQQKGGPCGVLASIQACMLQQLLFMDSRVPTIGSLQPLPKQRTQCLAKAISHVLWRAGENKEAIVALPSSKVQYTVGGKVKRDGLSETLVLNHFKSKEDLQDFVTANIGVFEDASRSGCILFLYCAILSRTIDRVIEDMDEPTNKLMGAHGYCTQEMVNLILTGKAVSNVFNDIMELDSGGREKSILKGITGRSEIGLLSLFEHYGSCQVGINYKTPKWPIWVVCSESHFSVLFSLKKELLSDWRAERRFDLYYYDGLARQQEEIKLSIDTTQSCPSHDEDDLVPPLEHCIRTKWNDAVVDWNGSEPIL